jgi:hypothetical protein
LKKDQLALYTTVYPGVEQYLHDWFISVKNQTDSNFDIWVGVDGISMETVKEAVGEDFEAKWVFAEKGDSPAGIRSKSISKIVRQYPAVVLVDSDDLLYPTRVASARSGLKNCDLYGCAMELVDDGGNGLGITFDLPRGKTLDDTLTRNNVMGFSNTAWRTIVLRDLLPAPADCTLMDWFLTILAWGSGASLCFDDACQMKYRQHSSNIAPVAPPFSEGQVTEGTRMVLHLYSLVLERAGKIKPDKLTLLKQAQTRAKSFSRAISSPEVLGDYVNSLNRTEPDLVWWSHVANPKLEKIWNQ